MTRPAAGAEPVKVMLTAIITLGGQSTEKKFEVTVQPMPADLDTDYTAGYLWTNFDASGGYEKIFFGYSEDGLNWSKLNKDANGNPQPVLVNDAEGSDLGVRDPHPDSFGRRRPLLDSWNGSACGRRRSRRKRMESVECKSESGCLGNRTTL